MMSFLDTLRARGFDLASHVPFTREYRVRCSQCQACAINGMACHETGGPNMTRECGGCNATIPARSRYCAGRA